MNFISGMESDQIQLELKYCERCGGLFLRPRADEKVHCEECTAHLAAIPHLAEPSLPKTRGARLTTGPKRPKRDLQGTAQIHSLEAVSLEVHV
jgi:ribosomal protein S27AE